MGRRRTKLGQIVSTSFPRSSSRFARALFETLYGPENYLEGLCRIKHLDNDNAFTIIRNPKQAIPSWISAVENYFEGFAGFTVENVVEESIIFYIEWMDAIEKRIGKIFISTFENFTENTQEELDKISIHFNLPKVKYNKNEIFVDYKHIPGGNPYTELAKTAESHKDFYKAVESYNRVINLLNNNG